MSQEMNDREIVIVDDDPVYLWALERELLKAGFTRITLYDDPYEALTGFKRGTPPAFVVSDFKMPGLTGLEFLRKTEALFPGVCALMITGEPSMALQEKHRFIVLEKTADIGKKVAEIVLQTCANTKRFLCQGEPVYGNR